MNDSQVQVPSIPQPHLKPALAALAVMLAVPAAIATDNHHGRDNRFEARLRGYQEVPTLSTASQGRFKATYDASSKSLHYELSYSNMEADARQAHIHLGARGTNGGIMVWLCQSATNVDPTGGSPTCPLRAGAVTGVIDASRVIGPAGQGVAATEFDKFVGALCAGAAYVNVHTVKYGSGEIRGQIRSDD